MRIDKAKMRFPVRSADKEKQNKRVSVYGAPYKEEFYNISVEKLVPFQNQSRKVFDEKGIREMADTIKQHGIRQPLTVLSSEHTEGLYEIVSGERRWRAAQLIGMKTVPCIIMHNRVAAEEIALIENIQRKNLHPIELMHGFQGLLDNKVCADNQEIAAKVGVSQSFVSETLSLSKLPESTRSLLLENSVKSRSVLRTLMKTEEKRHRTVINQYLQKNSTNKSRGSTRNRLAKINLVNIFLKNAVVEVETDAEFKLTAEQKSDLIYSLHSVIENLQKS